jgi:hypothetical protein
MKRKCAVLSWGLPRALAARITALSIRGDSRLIIDHIAHARHHSRLIPTPALLPPWDRCAVGTAQLQRGGGCGA